MTDLIENLQVLSNSWNSRSLILESQIELLLTTEEISYDHFHVSKKKKHATKFYHHKSVILANLDKWFSLNPIKSIRVVLFVYPNVCFFLSSIEAKLKLITIVSL